MSTNEPAAEPEYDFYVIFHGSFAFHDDKEKAEIDVYATDIREHVYQAGSWMGEQPLVDGGDFELCGVSPGCETIHGEHTISLQGSPVPAAEKFRKITVPRPAKVFFRMIAEGTIVDHRASGSNTVDWGLVPVFAYHRSSQPVKLTGPHFRWQEPVCGWEPTTLHIWATDDKDRREQHNDLTKSAGIFGKVVKLEGEAGSTRLGDDVPDLSDRLYEMDELLYTRCNQGDETGIIGTLKTCGPVAGGN